MQKIVKETKKQITEQRIRMERTVLDDDDESIRITQKDLPQEFILKLLGRHNARGLWGIKNTREPVDMMVRYAKTHELSLPIVQVVVTREGIFMSPIQCRLDNQSRDNICIRKIDTRYQSNRKAVNLKTPVSETWNNDGVVKPQLKPCNIAQAVFKQIQGNYLNGDTAKAATEREEKFKCYVNKKTEEKKMGPPTDLLLLEKYSKMDWRKKGIFFFGIDTISYGVQDLIYTRVFSMIVVSNRNTKSSERAPFMCHAFVCESRSTAKKITYALAAAFQAYGRSMKHLRGDGKLKKKSHEEKPRKVIVELRPHMEVALNDSEA